MPHPDTLEATHSSAPGLISSPSGFGGEHELNTQTLTYLLTQREIETYKENVHISHWEQLANKQHRQDEEGVSKHMKEK